MKTVSLLDTTITSYNLGNEIIMESVLAVMDELFPSDFLYRVPWEGPVSRQALRYMRSSDYVFFGGTNSLSSYMLKYKQMGFRFRDLVTFNNLTLLGMGWWQYQGKPDFYTRFFLNRLLSSSLVHSVRDEYTKDKLSSIGINATLNTCCPSTWMLSQAHCEAIPTKLAENVVVTLTDYNQDNKYDKQLLSLLRHYYKKIFIWIQGAGDLKYVKSLQGIDSQFVLIPPKLKSYDQVLTSVDCDYIGTRLHAGIRAIQKGRRTLILAVDNRATEISKDIGLNVKPRGDVSFVENFISSQYETRLTIPVESIKCWKAQFV